MRKAPVKQELRKPPDFTIFFTVLILTAFGLVMVFSASYITALESRGDAFFFLRRQAFWIGLGLVGMYFTTNFNYWKWRKVVPLMLLVNFLLLLCVFIPGLGVELGGARRWITLGGPTVQPAEFTKLALIVFTAAFLSKKNIDMQDFWRSSFVPLLMTGCSFLLILVQPDLGTSVALAMTIGIIIFAAGIPWKQLFYLIVFSLPLLLYFSLSEKYRMQRIFSFLDPWADPLDTGYQIIQSLYAELPVPDGQKNTYGEGFPFFPF
jgi:cell division protein FtsW